jgi:hypothetical protein
MMGAMDGFAIHPMNMTGGLAASEALVEEPETPEAASLADGDERDATFMEASPPPEEEYKRLKEVLL